MATGSSLTQNYSRSQSEIQGDLHKMTMKKGVLNQLDAIFTLYLTESKGSVTWIALSFVIEKPMRFQENIHNLMCIQTNIMIMNFSMRISKQEMMFSPREF
ncbi:hypothetical protein TNCV_607031 [Trichonephila clavipes]|nr:hypothetical protein TNCV_607031 [Trichonephila clavipes]